MKIWNLDDENLYFRLPPIEISRAFTWGSEDRAKREVVRKAALTVFPPILPHADWWAFRIFVQRPDDFDVDNVPKIIVDAFCVGQIRRDGSEYISVGLYQDDTATHVGMVQIAGEQNNRGILTTIEVFGRKDARVAHGSG